MIKIGENTLQNSSNEIDSSLKEDFQLIRQRNINLEQAFAPDFIEGIFVFSDYTNVNISSSNIAEKIEIKFSGELEVSGHFDLKADVSGKLLRIFLTYTGEYFSGDCELNITVPEKIFKSITVISTSAVICVDENVNAETVKLTTDTGDVFSHCIFKSLFITIDHGSITVDTIARSDIFVSISANTSELNAHFRNICKSDNLQINTEHGKIINSNRLTRGYKISGNIFIRFGDIMLS